MIRNKLFHLSINQSIEYTNTNSLFNQSIIRLCKSIKEIYHSIISSYQQQNQVTVHKYVCILYHFNTKTYKLSILIFKLITNWQIKVESLNIFKFGLNIMNFVNMFVLIQKTNNKKRQVFCFTTTRSWIINAKPSTWPSPTLGFIFLKY